MSKDDSVVVTQADRSPLELVMFAAWVNVSPDQVPDTMRGPTCAATMEAWKRVGEAAVTYLTTEREAALMAQVERLREALQAASDHLDYCGYGDAYERECAHASGLADQIETALATLDGEPRDD